MKIRIKQDCSKSCPGDHIVRHYKRGLLLHMSWGYSTFPGKHYTEGTIGWLVEKKRQGTDKPVHKEWAFWSNGDIDFALILEPEDIDRLYLTNKEYSQLTPEAISSANFEIIIE